MSSCSASVIPRNAVPSKADPSGWVDFKKPSYIALLLMTDPREFIRFAAGFEAFLMLLACGLGWLAEIPRPHTLLTLRAVGIGVAATLPLLAFYFVSDWLPVPAFRRIHQLLMTTLGRPLAACRWYDLALLAVLAGVCEEALFRGVLQPWIGRLGWPAGWIGANLLFGCAHAVTPTYAIITVLIGGYLSGVQAVAGGNLAAAMLTHGLYDFLAFLLIAREYRRNPEVALDEEPPEA